MSQSSDEYYSFREVISAISNFFSYLKRKTWVLILAALIGVGAGALYYFSKKPVYEAVCTFILEENNPGSGGLSSIASQFGFDISSLSGGGSIFAGDNILDILKSKAVVQKVLLSKTDSIPGSSSQTLADLFLDYSGWKKKWANDKKIANANFYGPKNVSNVSLIQDSILNLIHTHIIEKSLKSERLNKKGTIIKVSIVAENPYFAKMMTDRIVQEAKEFYIRVKTNTSHQNVIRLERKSDSLLALLNNKSYEAAKAIELDGNPALKELSVPSELKIRDKVILGSLYTEVVKNLELSRISLTQQTPIIQVLDSPSYPLILKKKSLIIILLVGVFCSLLLAVLYLAIQYIMKHLTMSANAEGSLKKEFD